MASRRPTMTKGAEIAKWKKATLTLSLVKREAARNAGAFLNSVRKDLEVARIARGLMRT